MEIFKDFDVLWLQSTPVISALFYHKYLQDSHVLYCPDDNNEPLNLRHVARFIIQVMDSNDKKKIALHFMTPCTVKRQETIINLIKKSRKTLSCYCLSIPTTEYQTNLLLGWSAEIKDPLWKRRCVLPLDPEYFTLFTPPTEKNGCSDWNEFNNKFVISNERFNKTALIVDLTKDMVTFNLEEGLCFNEGIESAIKGLINASNSSPCTLIWIIDESKLYGDYIKNTLQERREGLLKKYREALRASVESFKSSLPIYCYTLDYFNAERTTWINCLAQIQHRHHICFSRSIMLRGSENDLPTQPKLNIKMVYLNTMAIYNESKWKDMFLTDFQQINRRGFDRFEYISPDILGIETVPDNYKIPLLTFDNTGPLTISEPIGIFDTVHSVSAQSLDIFNQWVTSVMEYIPENNITEETDTSVDSSLSLLDRVTHSLTTEKIQNFLNNTRSFEKGKLTVDSIRDTYYEVDDESITIEARSKMSSSIFHFIIITFNADGSIQKGSCDCAVGRSGTCKHCAATMIYFKEHADKFKLKKPFNWANSFQSDTSSSSRKRSSHEEESDSSESKKHKSLFGEKSSFSIEEKRKEKEYDSEATEPYDPESTDRDSSFNLSNSNSSELHIPVEHEYYSVHASGSSDSIGFSSSTITLPSIPSSSSKSLSLNSSSSGKKSSFSYPTCTTSSGDGSLAPVIEESQEYGYSYEEEHNEGIIESSSKQNLVYVTAEEGTLAESSTRSNLVSDAPTQPYHYDSALETQPYNYNDQRSTQQYDTCEAQTQPYNYNDSNSSQQNDITEAPTQPYNFNDQDSTQQYDTCEAPTQAYDYNDDDTTQCKNETSLLEQTTIEAQESVTREVIEISSNSSGRENKSSEDNDSSKEKNNSNEESSNNNEKSTDDESNSRPKKPVIYIDFDDDDDDDFE